MKKLLVIIGVIIVGAAIWFIIWGFPGDEQQPAQTEPTQPQDFPARVDESGETAELTRFESEFSDLTFTYPNNWNVTEGADNSEEDQLLTVESPLDENEFYFCLDLHVVTDTADASFAIDDAEILATETLENGDQSVIYQLEGLSSLQWGVSTETVNEGDESFVSRIDGASGAQAAVFGRFDCRETESEDIEVDEFQNARWFHEANDIVQSLSF
ncbi:MAG: hypothetical protein U5L95_03230 [Candidatus Saccharibacteria bacterium]|nr:hypothetical protein [Candidatus Saccharibacteria bacterium]